MKKQSNIAIFIIALFGVMFFMADGYAQNKEIENSDSDKIIQQEVISAKLNDIRANIKLLKRTIDKKLKLLKSAKTEQEKNDIKFSIKEFDNSISEQENSFELIQTGGLELAKIEGSKESKFDWQKDLLEILQPIMNELRQLTEDKRKLVNLKNKITFYKVQIQGIDEALEKMMRIDKGYLKKDALQYFEQINKKWKDLRDESNHLMEVAQLQLDGAIKSQGEHKVSISDYLAGFAVGRGATIIMAGAAFFFVFFFMIMLWRRIIYISVLKRNSRRSYFQRVSSLVYHVATSIFSLIAVFYVINVRNDQILFGIAVLILIIVALALRNSIPNYIHKIQILLNAGAVREGEHVIYNGIPMMVENLGLYTKLINPTLPHLSIRLPLSKMSEYISRPYAKDELWFPCRQDDFVLLADDTYGKVTCITLENVLVSFFNGMNPKTYNIADFLAASPINLSEGFVIFTDFGIDYKYQEKCTTSIPELFCEGIRKGLLREKYAGSLQDVKVYFSQANSSSLDYRVRVMFDGKAAVDYYAISRDLQRYAVEVCNQQQWEIPFSQLSVHMNKV